MVRSAADTQQATDGDDLSWQQLVFQSCGGLLLLGLGDRMALVASLTERERSYRAGCDEMLLRAIRDAALTGEWNPYERRDRVRRILAGYVMDVAAARTH
jgi:hypothetical protein